MKSMREKLMGQVRSLEPIRRATRPNCVKMITQNPADKNRVTWLPRHLAWIIARAVAMETHDAVLLHGTYGVAHFRPDGSGHVEWNEKSTLPGQTTEFDAHTLVAIS